MPKPPSINLLEMLSVLNWVRRRMPDEDMASDDWDALDRVEATVRQAYADQAKPRVLCQFCANRQNTPDCAAGDAGECGKHLLALKIPAAR